MESSEIVEGQGGFFEDDDHHLRGNVRLVRAYGIKNPRFPILPGEGRDVVVRLQRLADSEDGRVAVAANKALIAAGAINQKDEQFEEGNARLDAGKASAIVDHNHAVVIYPIDEYRAKRLSGQQP